MSKYIRIDNGVYKIGISKTRKEDGISNYYYIKVGQDFYLTFDEEELNKGRLGDTIEELCDNFLVEYKNGEHMMFHDFYHLKRHHDLYSQPYHHVIGRYGCIWVVGKGLIYVAKMNEKGELELI